MPRYVFVYCNRKLDTKHRSIGAVINDTDEDKHWYGSGMFDSYTTRKNDFEYI